MKLLRKARALYQRVGLRGTLAKLVSSAAAVGYAKHTELLLLKRLEGELSCPAGWDVELITPAHEPDLRVFNERYRGRKQVRLSRRYLEHGYRGFLVRRNGGIAGYWWWVDNRSAPVHPCLTRFQLDLADGEVYGFDYFIAPDFRAQGAAVKILAAMYGELRRRGFKSVWAFVDARNVPARIVYATLRNTVMRKVVSRSVVSTVLLQGARVFLKRRRSYDYELLVSLPR